VSTKIYFAWRLPRGLFDRFLPVAHDVMLSAVGDLVSEMASKLAEDPIREEYKDSPRVGPGPLPIGLRVWVLYTMFRKEEGSPSLWEEVSCGWRIWLGPRYAYFMPWGPYAIKDRLRNQLPSEFEEYAYYNNTDRPGHITKRQWEARRRAWNKIALDEGRESTCRLDNLVMSKDAYQPQARLMASLNGEMKLNTGRKRRQKRPPADSEPALIDDGFGNSWPKCEQENCELEVVRPGKVQCSSETCPRQVKADVLPVT